MSCEHVYLIIRQSLYMLEQSVCFYVLLFLFSVFSHVVLKKGCTCTYILGAIPI